MKTTFELETLLWHYLRESAFATELRGGFYKHKRPIGSQAEDVVIVSLPINNLEVQTAVVNVNIHVPNMSLKMQGQVDARMPDLKRLKELADIALPLLKEYWDPQGDWCFEVQQQNVFEDEDGSNHYINIRLDFYSINILN
jgi:hypothetical protein